MIKVTVYTERTLAPAMFNVTATIGETDTCGPLGGCNGTSEMQIQTPSLSTPLRNKRLPSSQQCALVKSCFSTHHSSLFLWLHLLLLLLFLATFLDPAPTSQHTSAARASCLPTLRLSCILSYNSKPKFLRTRLLRVASTASLQSEVYGEILLDHHFSKPPVLTHDVSPASQPLEVCCQNLIQGMQRWRALF